jgi:ferritin-like metal-binding protein YciE
MSNMHYCRFQNNYDDLQDCFDHINDNDLSKEEEKARSKLIRLCKDIAEEFEDDE